MLYLFLYILRDLFRARQDLLLQNLALRQQLLVLERQVRQKVKKPEFRDRDRAFWVILSRFWPGWKWKSRPKDLGRPKIPPEAIELIRKISLENPTWGAGHIQGEMMMLGYILSEGTIAKYMVRRRGQPNQNWKTFIRNHLHEIGAIDFLTVPTITFRTLYIFIVLSLDRRRVVHFHVTYHPTADWTALQLTQAFPFDTAPKYLIRDRDKIYGSEVLETIENFDMKDKPTSPRSPWQNGYCERMVGTLKRECLNHMIIINERHAYRIIREFLQYYHNDRTHQGLEQETPNGRKIEPPEIGPVKRRPILSGLHHRYYREAA